MIPVSRYRSLLLITDHWLLVAGCWLLNLEPESPMIKSNWSFSNSFVVKLRNCFTLDILTALEF